MNGVFLRCPNCGTTQSSAGECEACHEANVRYYCSNHTPGIWVDKPVCSRCGAKFGEIAPPPPPPPIPPPPVRPSRPAATSVTPPKPVRRWVSPWTRREDVRPAPGIGDREEHAAEILRRLILARTRERTWEDHPPVRPTARSGCLRLVLFAILLMFLLFVFGPSFIGALLIPGIGY